MQLAAPCLLALALALLASACGEGAGDKPCIAEPPWIDEEPGSELLAFSVASDMRTAVGGSGSKRFYDALLSLEGIDDTGPGAFLVSPGDLDPASSGVFPAIEAVLGEGFPWFPIPGNHDAETLADMEFLRTYDPSALAASAAATHYASGPSGAPTTCYSFDSGGAHFVFLNLYYDGSSDTGPAPSSAAAGTVSPPLYAWLEADLKAAAARSPAYLFVFGHEPLYPLPDDATGRVRHRGDSLDAHPAETEAFAELLRDYGVTAYICGHTHDYSSALVDRILQVLSLIHI